MSTVSQSVLTDLAGANGPPSGVHRVDALVNTANLLAAPPRAVKLLLQLAAQKDADLGVMACVVGQEPALATALRRLAGAVLDPHDPDASVTEAIARLGAPAFAALAATAAASGMLDRESPAAPLMERAIVVAALCRRIAPVLGAPAEEASLCGLLHDLGGAMLLRQRGGGYGDDRPGASEGLDHERARLGFDHAALGACALGTWGVSEVVCTVVRYHHDIASASARGPEVAALVKLVSFCDAIADGVAAAPGTAHAWIDRALRDEAAAHLDLNADAVWILRGIMRGVYAPESPEDVGGEEGAAAQPAAIEAGCFVCGGESYGSECPCCSEQMCVAHEAVGHRWCRRCEGAYRAERGLMERVLFAAGIALSFVATGVIAAAQIYGDPFLKGFSAAALLACALVTVAAVCVRGLGRAQFRVSIGQLPR